jgi:peroxiredoxin
MMAAVGMARKIDVGERISELALTSISGEEVRVPDPDELVHLQFRRFAGCPYCNLHLHSFATEHDRIRAAGVREVVLFHSSAEQLRAHNEEVPFAVVADPEKRLYRQFGVESSPRAVLDPRAWYPGIRGAVRRRNPLAGDQRAGVLGLPADFLIASDGRVVARKYGAHAYDQWSVDELLSLVPS